MAIILRWNHRYFDSVHSGMLFARLVGPTHLRPSSYTCPYHQYYLPYYYTPRKRHIHIHPLRRGEGWGRVVDHPWFFDPKQQNFTNFHVKLFLGPKPFIWDHQRSFRTVFIVTAAVPKWLIDFLWNALMGAIMVRLRWNLKCTPKIHSFLIYVTFFEKLPKMGIFVFEGQFWPTPKMTPMTPL